MDLTIIGQLIGSDPQQSLANLVVEAFYRYQGQVLKTDRASTDSAGGFKFQFSDALLANIVANQPVAVFFQVYRGDRLLESRGGITGLQAQHYELKIEVADEAPPDTDAQEQYDKRLVRGTITDAAGRPVAGLAVTVSDRDMRAVQELGSATTDGNGSYQVRYTRVQFRRAEKENADLVVTVTDAAGAVIAQSDTLFNAPEIAVIDQELSAKQTRLVPGLSEHERHTADVLLVVEKIPPSELNDADLDFVTQECRISLDELRALRLDAQWSTQHQMPIAAFYGLMRENMPSDFRALLEEKPSRWRQALKSAIERNIVPAALQSELESIFARLAELAAKQAFVEPDPGQPAPLGLVVQTTSLTPEVQRQFVHFAQNHEEDGDFWEAFTQQVGADEKVVGELRFVTESAPLLFNHVPVLTAIQALKLKNGWQTPRDLARLSRSDWRRIATESSNPTLPGKFVDADEFAEAIADRVDVAFPTAVIAYRAEADPDIGGADLVAFVEKHEDFDFLDTQIDSFLDDSTDLDDGVDRISLGDRLKTLQRTAFLAPSLHRADTMMSLIQEGFGSTFHVLDKDEDTFRFIMEPLIGSEAVSEVRFRAEARADILGLVAAQLGDSLNVPAVIPGLHGPESGAVVLPEIETLARMFGSLNGCRCEHCSSMYSASAYLVDVLQYLRDTPNPAGRPAPGESAGPWLLNTLFSRRPDIEHLKLNCANATVSVPYIDLVNEILERAVVGAAVTDFDWSSYQTPEANTGEPESIFKARILAEPRKINEAARDIKEAAYELLSSPSYPWMLPFDANEQRALALAQHLGLDWAELYRLFGRVNTAVARAELGLWAGEWELLAREATTEDVGDVWGAPASELRVASTFARQAGLTIDEVFTLVKSWFLTSKGEPVVTLMRPSDADPCDFDDYRLEGLNHRVLDQLHRFLRLRQRLGWSITELDEVLRAGAFRSINAETLSNVARLIRVAERFGRTEVQVAGMQDVDLPRWLGISDAEITLFAELIGVPVDRFSELSQRLALFERWLEFRDLETDVRKLSYLLLGHDAAPPVFAPLPEATRAFLTELHSFVQAKRASGELPGTGVREDVGILSDQLVDNLASYLRIDTAVCERLVGRVSLDETSGAEVEEVTALIRFGNTAPRLPAIAVVRQFVNVVATDGAPDAADPAAYEDARAILQRLDRVAQLIRGLELSRPQLDVVASAHTDNGFLDFDLIRIEAPTDDSADLYDGWLALAKTRATKVEFERSRIDLFALMSAATDATIDNMEFFDSLASATGWNRDTVTGEETGSITVILEAMGYPGDRQRAAFQNVETFARVHTAVRWIRRWRINAPTLAGWSSPGQPVAELADSLQQAARARQSDDANWFSVLRPINDRLREARRDALLAYLLTHGAPNPDGSPDRLTFDDSAEVYAHYLIDPEMSACMQTSRIVQANASIQLLVQRVLQKLESMPELVKEQADAWHQHWQRWPVMKTYRVWEANRKVFFYPENWLFPDLRDDKSPFFVDLENALLQDEVNDATVSRAYREYLTRLNEVANLDIRGFYIEERHNTEVMHLFARTHNEPHLYFYRRRDLISGVWTAWDKLELNIEGDHLIPVVHNGQLMLFWAQIKAKGGDEEESQFNKFELGLVYSCYRNGSWEAPQQSKSKKEVSSSEIQELSLRAYIDSGKLIIRVYLGVVRDAFVYFDSVWDTSFVLDTRRNALRFQSTDGSDDVRLFHPPETKIRGTLFERRREEEGDLLLPTMGLSDSVLWANVAPILNVTPGQFHLVPGTQFAQLDGERPFFYQDPERSFLVQPEWLPMRTLFDYGRIQDFELAYHPYICEIVERFEIDGFTGVLSPPAFLPSREGFEPKQNFLDRQHVEQKDSPLTEYWPTDVVESRPVEDIDFELTKAYANYNWELFFHIPLLVATCLSQAQRFEDAQRCFHYIFDPTDTSPHPAPARVWRVKPFFELAKTPPTTLAQLLEQIARRASNTIEQVHAWRKDPFNPHAIARLRHVAYMKAVVMAYLDNLITWADDLFRQFTREQTSEAANLYLLALEIMGPRPVQIPAIDREDFSFAELNAPDELGNPWIDLESMMPIDPGISTTLSSTAVPRLLPYFCLPSNDKLLALWDTVADRLFKVRHCMDIEGRLRTLPLFEPPIDPGLLVRARAAGVDLRSALRGSSEVPNYRFVVMQQKSLEFCAEVRSLGAAVLAALEKRDAEALGLLRSTHEMILLNAMTEIRTRQVDEARETIAGLLKGREIAETRLEFYRSREPISSGEAAALRLERLSGELAMVSQRYSSTAAVMGTIPQFHAQLMASGTSIGGQQIAAVLNAYAEVGKQAANLKRLEASETATMASYGRRGDDWMFQADLAEREISQVDRQIIAAEIRLEIVKKELDNHRKQVAQAQEVDAYLRGKFTNRQLYDWMAGQLSKLHYQAYQLALDMAFKAQAAANFELGYHPTDDSALAIISFQHSDPGYRRLTAGESLAHELRRLDAAYMELNRRQFEITKHISLSMLDPGALIELKATGSCDVSLPEWLFDLDYPGHLNRCIKSVSVTIPCVTGPHTSVSCTLSLMNSWKRYASGERVELEAGNSIATSSAQNDSGVFELNFRDERYLPFEGAGAESAWKIELSGKWLEDDEVVDLSLFDFDTISDVVLSISYTAQMDETRKSAVLSDLIRYYAGVPLARGFSLRHEFPTQWNELFDRGDDSGPQTASFPLTLERFPLLVQRKGIDISAMDIYPLVDPGHTESVDVTTLSIRFGPTGPPDATGEPILLEKQDGVIKGAYLPPVSSIDVGNWELTMSLSGGRVPRDAIKDVVVVCRFTIDD